MNETLSNLAKGYNQAVLTVVWTVQNGFRELMFAAVELVPEYLGEQHPTGEIGTLVKPRRLYYKRHVFSAEDGLAWYAEAIQRNELTMPWQQGTKIYLHPSNCKQPNYTLTPRWPETLYNDKFPFRARYGQGVRVSNYMSTEQLVALEKFISNAEVAEWIGERLMWPLNENLEYLGSVNLVLPNRYYCHSRMRLAPADDPSEADSINVYFDRDCAGDDLCLLLQERINGCYAAVRRVPITDKHMHLDLMGRGDEVAYCVVDADGQVVDQQDFAPFLRRIVVGMDIVNSVSTFTCSDGKMQTCDKTSHSEQIICGDEMGDLPELTLHNRMAKMAHARDLKYRAKEQYVFGRNHRGEAERKIREIVNSAKHKLVVIDPYCSSETAEMYFPAINSDVQVFVYCTRKGFDDKAQEGCLKIECDRFRAFLEMHGKSDGRAIVSICDKSSLHDRFILVDDSESWMLGSSLVSLGKGLSVILKMENGASVAHELEECVSECVCMSFDVFVNNLTASEPT